MTRTCVRCGKPIKHLRPDSAITEHTWCQSPALSLHTPSLQIGPNVLEDTPKTHAEWLAWRLRGIGGSDAPIIMNASPWASRFDLWARKIGIMAPQPMTYPMWRGIKLEPKARSLYEEVTGLEMEKRCLRRTDFDFARGSFDAFNPLPKGSEIKCPGKDDHLLALNGKIPEKYIWQLVHLCWVGNLSSIDYFSYNPRKNFDGPKIAKVTFKRDLEMERTLIREEEAFWQCVVNNELPPDGPESQTKRTSPINVFPIRSRKHE